MDVVDLVEKHERALRSDPYDTATALGSHQTEGIHVVTYDKTGSGVKNMVVVMKK